MKSDFVMLAQDWDGIRDVKGWYISDKLDGIRCIWDGAVSLGRRAADVPWANTAKTGKDHICTGLWTRYGKVIHAPSWFIKGLPIGICLDGELYTKIQDFQRAVSIVKQHNADSRWADIKYMVFDSPSLALFLQDRKIDSQHFKRNLAGCSLWAVSQRSQPVSENGLYTAFQDRLNILPKLLADCGNWVRLHNQKRLPELSEKTNEMINDELDRVTLAGGEGLILRRGLSIWKPERTWDLLKIKKLRDAEGVIVGYKAGKETDKGSKLLGMMGSLRVSWQFTEFDISGFSDDERRMVYIKNGNDASDELASMPGLIVPNHIHNPLFKRGTKITFKYRDLTSDGTPKEARFHRF